MAFILKLTPGREAGSYTPKMEQDRIETLRATVLRYMPDFVKMVELQHEQGIDLITVHQDGFAGGYHTDEYTLLGLAIKYAGLYGIAVMVTGTNGETFK